MRDQDRTMAWIAAGQQGVITTAQLLAIGLNHDAIARRVAAGRLHRVHRGVYAVGHPGLSLQGRYLAAVLACGPGSVLSHHAAAHLLSLVRGPAPAATVTTRQDRQPAGVRVHRSRNLDPLDTAVLDAIPITTVPRTLLDLAGDLSLAALSRAVHEAHVRHGTTPVQVEAAIARTPNRRGVTRLRQALRGDGLLLSKLEAEFLRVLRAAGLPLPRTNVRRPEGRVDCHWPELDLVVELDSFRFHATRHQWEQDVRRARQHRGTHLRFTWGDVFERPHSMLTELAPLLRRPA